MKSYMKLLLVILFSFLLKTGTAQNSTPDKQYKGVRLETIHSEILDEDRTIFVYAPENNSGAKLPVLYLLDGEMARPFGEILEFARINPHIIVGISNNGNRNRDMIPVIIDSRPGSGGADKFLHFLTKELKPHINSSYNSNGESILVGASNAGLFTVYAMLAKPEEYFAYIALSPTIGYCNDYMTEKAVQLSPKSRLDDKHLYILYGLNREMPEVTDYVPGFTRLLKSQFQHINVYSEGLQDANHVPIEGLQEGLLFVYKETIKAP